MPGIDTGQWLQWVARMRQDIDDIRADPIIADAPPAIREKSEAMIAKMEHWIWEATAAAGEPAELAEAAETLDDIAADAVELHEWYAEQKSARSF